MISTEKEEKKTIKKQKQQTPPIKQLMDESMESSMGFDGDCFALTTEVGKEEEEPPRPETKTLGWDPEELKLLALRFETWLSLQP